MRCPACDHDNIQGTDLCENCGLDLAGLDLPGRDLDPEDPLLGRPVGELGLQKAPVLGPEARVFEALQMMRERRHGCVFVQNDQGRLVGVFTEHDVVSRVAARRKDPGAVRLGDVMTPRPYTLKSDDPLAWALNRMGVEGQRHVPVLEGDGPLGFLSVRVVLKALLDA